MSAANIKVGAVAGIISLMALGATAAQASTSALDAPPVVVHYSDLDLSTTAGAEMLYKRIESAAEKVCPSADSQLLIQYRAGVRCRAAVVAQTVAGIHSPQLVAVYEAKTHHSLHSPV